ncbi:hypothetical protein [Salinispora arenicola]|uniref:hypothetical protein n=1 Tax=Salinispora arenicola TaxID=168697 RepID=UPI000576758E|nr:hypothetical protein [Salinispora arenicola]
MTFRCDRYPQLQVWTEAGTVHFRDGQAEVSNIVQAETLRRLGDEYSVVEVSPPEPDAPNEPPAPSAVKAEWVSYAVRVHDADPDAAEALTKTDLIETYGPQSE